MSEEATKKPTKPGDGRTQRERNKRARFRELRAQLAPDRKHLTGTQTILVRRLINVEALAADFEKKLAVGEPSKGVADAYFSCIDRLRGLLDALGINDDPGSTEDFAHSFARFMTERVYGGGPSGLDLKEPMRRMEAGDIGTIPGPWPTWTYTHDAPSTISPSAPDSIVLPAADPSTSKH